MTCITVKVTSLFFAVHVACRTSLPLLPWPLLYNCFITAYTDIPVLLLSPGTGPIVLHDLQCVGNEGSLLECEHPEVMVRNCYRNEEVRVSCKEG